MILERGIRFFYLGICLALALIASLCELFTFSSAIRAHAALEAADLGAAERSIDLCNSALFRDPGNSRALYLRAVQLKATPADPQLAPAIDELLLYHPNQAASNRLAGENAYLQKDHELAGEFLWRAGWINPTPPTSPSNYWRMNALAFDRFGAGERAIFSATRALALFNNDQGLNSSSRGELIRDMGRVFDRAGKSSIAMHLETLSRNSGDRFNPTSD